jgi:hypothetical protein
MNAFLNLVQGETPAMFANAFGEAASAIIARELKYATSDFNRKASQASDGSHHTVIRLDTQNLRDVQDRLSVQLALATMLNERGIVNEDGSPKLFTPVIVPFHVDPTTSEPATQVRAFYFRPAPKKFVDRNGQEFSKTQPSTLIIQCEPYGFETKFDAESQYAKSVAVAV